ncbi:hypothetical protein EI94DRAFT_1745945 [Lactarius quietus]|nr:hypothetical protein EI94DRAFT_1745945 [Lactarius quietus]
MRRRARRQRYWALSRKRLPSRSTFLAGESMDMPHSTSPQPTSPSAYSYADNIDPFATQASRPPTGRSGGSGSPPPSSYPYAAYSYSQRPDSPSHSPVPSSPPRLFRARASESGSIFHESVWPPPSAASQLTDPLTSPSHAVDLGSIVNDVMGPTTSDESGGDRSGRSRGLAREWSGTSEMGPLLASSSAGDHDRNGTLPLQQPETPPRPPQWLSRSPNPSPKNSPIQRPHAL